FTEASALEWLDAERVNLAAVCAFAAENGWTAHAIDLPTILYRYLYDNVHNDYAFVIYAAEICAGGKGGDRKAQVRDVTDMGWLWFVRGGYAQAREHFLEAVEHAVNARNDTAQARAQHGLASAYQQQGERDQALENFKKALELFRGQGDQFGQAV